MQSTPLPALGPPPGAGTQHRAACTFIMYLPHGWNRAPRGQGGVIALLVSS